MLIAIISYVITFFCVIKHRQHKKIKYEPFPLLTLKKDGVVFVSNKVHRIFIKNVKVMQVGKIVYLTKRQNVIILSNVDSVIEYDNYLYFTALGRVKIYFNCERFYRYFNINIISSKFSIYHLKRNALLDLICNYFQVDICKYLHRYIRIITKVLNISVENQKIIVKQNRYKLPFVLTYKLNGVIRRINVKQTLEEI